jgi:hypothetical protein
MIFCMVRKKILKQSEPTWRKKAALDSKVQGLGEVLN